MEGKYYKLLNWQLFIQYWKFSQSRPGEATTFGEKNTAAEYKSYRTYSPA
jgi:hypothetical protein